MSLRCAEFRFKCLRLLSQIHQSPHSKEKAPIIDRHALKMDVECLQQDVARTRADPAYNVACKSGKRRERLKSQCPAQVYQPVTPPGAWQHTRTEAKVMDPALSKFPVLWECRPTGVASFGKRD